MLKSINTVFIVVALLGLASSVITSSFAVLDDNYPKATFFLLNGLINAMWLRCLTAEE